tara:strand:- start:1183 stop:1548 length:366 start_codon:yes stop_codon:yes gene_type:complete
MAESKQIDTNMPLMFLSIALIIGSIVAFYYFSEIRLFYRVLGVIGTVILSSLIIYQTAFGKMAYTYVVESKVELKKVTWPTKQETTQTTLGVIFIVIIIGILLWLLDMLLGWAIGTLYGVT